jgi:hypothetical protein
MASELPSGWSEEEGMPRQIQKESHKVSVLSILTLFEPHREPIPLHEARKEIEKKGLTSWIVPIKILPLQAPTPGEPGERR